MIVNTYKYIMRSCITMYNNPNTENHTYHKSSYCSLEVHYVLFAFCLFNKIYILKPPQLVNSSIWEPFYQFTMELTWTHHHFMFLLFFPFLFFFILTIILRFSREKGVKICMTILGSIGLHGKICIFIS